MKVTYDQLLNEKAATARRRFELPVLIAALAVVPVIYIEETSTSTTMLAIADIANWLIWLAFAVEYTVVMTLTSPGLRWAYTKKSWLDVLVIVLSMPLLPALLASSRLLRLTRLARVFRLLKLVRLAAVLTRAGRSAGVIFKKRGLGYIVLLTVIVALGIGGVFAIIEGVNIFDGLWWAVVTLTTVGYGDVFPITPAGRVAASLLMLLGIGFVAVITASVAAYFVEDEEAQLADEIRMLGERLDRIERAIGGTDTIDDDRD
ncbi:MAG: ion channel [Acidimicrobiia bacterium]|nr:ion channel [Acidimicrobiia bacterium]